VTRVRSGHHICNNCLDADYTFCTECQEYVKNEDHNGLACNDCSATCAECLDPFLNDDLSRCGLCADCITAELCSNCCQSLGCGFKLEPEEDEDEEDEEDEDEPVTVLTGPDQNLAVEFNATVEFAPAIPCPVSEKTWNDLQEAYGFLPINVA
jgi:hypothetical protein